MFVGKIEKIEVISTSRELFLGEAPTVLEVQAFDAEGIMYNDLSHIHNAVNGKAFTST